jgi:hypothetical protein
VKVTTNGLELQTQPLVDGTGLPRRLPFRKRLKVLTPTPSQSPWRIENVIAVGTMCVARAGTLRTVASNTPPATSW